MYIANAAVENIGRVLNLGPIAYGFQCGITGLNINQAGVVLGFQETGHRCTLVSGGTSILYETTKYGEGVYLSDLGERKYGDWLVLWQSPKPSEEEPCSGRSYMSVQERGEEEAGLTIYGAEVYELLEEQGVTYTPGTMRIGVSVGDVSVASVAGQLLSVGHPISEATAFVDIGQRWYYSVWKGSPALNPLQVVWERKEQTPVVSTEFSEKELLDSWDKYLEEHWDELATKYKGKYVAIWEGDVYDSDVDLAALAERVYTALGYRPIFMPYISDKEQVYEFTSPA